MPVSNFISSFADKAQSAINAAGYTLPSVSHHESAAQPSANQAAAQGGHRSLTFESLQNQLRVLGQQYGSTSPVQKIITMEKSVAIDFDSISRDAKAQSKELYTWGQAESADLKDVTDRLAYLNFVQGSLASSLALKLDSARAPFKALRDAETALTPRRNMRAGMQLQLAKLEHDQQKGTEKRMAELKGQIRKSELDDEQLEKEIEILKRKAVRESELLKWEAMREYGEKLALLSQAATPIIGALPFVPPSQTSPYTGAQSTGAARASLQRALDNYKTGHINLPPQPSESDLHRSDTLSFGESHASELSSIDSGVTSPGIPSTPPPGDKPLSDTLGVQDHPPPIDPAGLNQSLAIIPTTSQSTPPVSASEPAPFVSDNAPTVAETGIPVTAGAAGPGPSSGSLLNIRPDATTGTVQKYESAEEEKKRLQATYSQPEQSSSNAEAPAPTSQHESAADEKKRLEREERERILRGNSATNEDASVKNHDEELPPYRDV